MANRIKIKVIDSKSNFRLRLPSIPFWLIISMINLAFLFKPLVLRHLDGLDQGTRVALDKFDSESIRELFDGLRRCGRFDLLDLSTGDGTEVKISIL
ncbi:MAG: hypothetical protein WCZ27_09570 [Tissierellaceae bacterium]